MDRTRRTKFPLTLSISFSEIKPRTAKVPHLPKGVTRYCCLPEVFWGSASRPQVHGSHGSPATTLIPSSTINVSKAGSLASLYKRIRFGDQTYGQEGKPFGGRSSKEIQILPRSHGGTRLYFTGHRSNRGQHRTSGHFYFHQQPIYLSGS